MRRAGLSAAAFALAYLLGACNGSGEPNARPSSPPAETTASPEPSPTVQRSSTPDPIPTTGMPAENSLLYSERGVLKLLDLDDGSTSELAAIPSQDVYVARDGGLIAYVTGSGPSGDFAARPELHVLDPPTGDGRKVGPGFLPLWNTEGGFAYIEPQGNRRCVAEACPGLRKVKLYDPESGLRRTLLPPGHWNLLAWAGSRVLVADDRDLSRTITVTTSGERGTLPFPPSEIWDASPDGHWLVRSFEEGAEYVPLKKGAVSGSPTPIPTTGAVLAEGTWTQDSERIAVVLLDIARGSAHTQLALTSPSDPTPAVVPGSDEASGSVLFDGSGTDFTYTRALDSGRLAAVVCSGGVESCREVLTWSRSILILHLY